jgi:2'-5' RNA ligase
MGDETRSAIIVRVPLPPSLVRIRRQWDWSAARGVPGHVTILFPFLPAARLDREVRAELAAVAGTHPPFDVQFRRVGRFPGVAYLVPEPAEPFARLTEAVMTRYPGYPPYEGLFDEIVPHLTLADSADGPLDRILGDALSALPLERRAAMIEVLAEDRGGRWRTRWRIPLGVRS